MSWSRHGCGEGRRGYHHGNLKEALIGAALELIADKGPSGFTIAETARLAEVSPAAPYRHFRDRQALMAEIARLGFERFEAELTRAWNGGRPDPLTALDNLGKAYLVFARSEPAYYAAMFEAGLPLDTSPEVAVAGDRAFAVLRAAIDSLCTHLPENRRPPALMVSLHIWALSHGIAVLFGETDATKRTLPMSPEDLLEAGVLVYLRGLGVLDDQPPPRAR